MEDKKILGVRKNIFFLGLVSFFNDFSAEMVQSVMPVFITVILGAPAFFVGFIEGTADAIASIFRLLSGWVSDKIGKRKMPTVTGYSLSVFTRLFLIFVTTFWQVFALRIVDRVGKGLRDSPRDALISESVPKEELGKSYGFHRAMDTLGATIGPLFAFLIIFWLKDGYRILFFIAFLLGLFAISSFIFVKDKKVNQLERQSRTIKLDWTIFKSHKKFILVVASLFVFGLGALPLGLVLLKAKDAGSIANIPLMYFIFNLTFVLVAIPLGKLADKIGERFVISAGFVMAIISYVGLIFAEGIFPIILLFIILGIYSAATDGMQRMLAAKSLHGEFVATGQGFLNMALGFSSLGAGLIGGILWTSMGSASAFLYAATLSVIGLILFVILSKNLNIE